MENYFYRFRTPLPPERVFKIVVDVTHWWSGLFGESFTGESKKLNDKFTFKAGDGAHYTEQELVELEPNRSVAWDITKANLSFVGQPDEWEGTSFRFDLLPISSGTEVTFTHVGLVEQFECYGACSNAWTGYLTKLQNELHGTMSR